MRTVITDVRINGECERNLAERGFDVIKLPASAMIQKPVSAHPDMLIFIGKDRLVCHRSYYDHASETLEPIADRAGPDILISDELWGQEYPNDVLFNAAQIGDRLICRSLSTSLLVLDAFAPENIVDVKQGYAKCSVCTVGNNGVITSDRSIAKSLEMTDIDLLLIEDGHTALDGYGCGFIGGTSGDDGENIYFCGNLELHPEADKIKEFCLAHGRQPISLSNAPLYDYGTLMFI